MKMLKLLLLLTIMAWGTISQAGVADSLLCIFKDKTTAPTVKTETRDGRTVDTAAWTAWKAEHLSDWDSAQNYNCCRGLIKNETTRKCEDNSMVDPDIQSCSVDNECTNGKGCFDLNTDDMFSTDSEDPAVINAMNVKERNFEQMLGTLGIEPKDQGNCFRNLECKSYKCSGTPGLCVQNKVCRLATKTELALGAVRCMKPFVKGPDSKCKSGETSIIPGDLGTLSVEQISGQQCQFELKSSKVKPDLIKDVLHFSLLTSRSMEWLFGTSSNNDHEDCLFLMEWMRKGIQPLIEKRKKIIYKFNVAYKRMEEDFAKVSKAVKGDMSEMLSPCGFTVTGNEIALRKSTGMDYLCYLRNRNDMFATYEKDMKALNAEMQEVTFKYSNTAWNFGESRTEWKIGDWEKDHDKRACRDVAWMHKKVYKRWSKKYLVRGRSDDNKKVFDHGMVNTYLSSMGNPDNFTASKYYLLDPLMPGGQNHGVNFENYGTDNELWSGNGNNYERQLGSGGFLNTLGQMIMNPGQVLVNSMQALGNKSGFIGIHANFRPHLIQYLKDLRIEEPITPGKASTNIAAKDFIYDPELSISFKNKGCLDNLEKPECRDMKNYVDTLQDIAFAQMLAYSQHSYRKYDHYFGEGTWRKALYVRYIFDFQNLGSYYTALAELRKKQNDCLQKVIDQLHGSDFNGEGMGISEGTGNYYTKSNDDYLSDKNKSKNVNAPKIAKKSVNPYQITIGASNKAFGGQGLMDAANSRSDASGGGMSSAAAGAMAAGMKHALAINAAALASGADVKARTAAFEKAVSAAARMSGSGSGANATGASAPTSTSSPSSSTNSSSGKDSDHASKAPGAVPHGRVGGAGAGGSISGMLGGLSSGSGSGSEETGDLSKDPTGMSDEEKDNMAANYDRTRGEYKTGEEDTLFQVLSKTYVRNLNKILVRKKKLSEDSASSPSEPSTP